MAWGRATTLGKEDIFFLELMRRKFWTKGHGLKSSLHLPWLKFSPSVAIAKKGKCSLVGE